MNIYEAIKNNLNNSIKLDDETDSIMDDNTYNNAKQYCMKVYNILNNVLSAKYYSSELSCRLDEGGEDHLPYLTLDDISSSFISFFPILSKSDNTSMVYLDKDSKKKSFKNVDDALVWIENNLDIILNLCEKHFGSEEDYKPYELKHPYHINNTSNSSDWKALKGGLSNCRSSNDLDDLMHETLSVYDYGRYCDYVHEIDNSDDLLYSKNELRKLADANLK